MSDVQKIEIYSGDRFVWRGDIVCTGELPQLVQFDDPEDGELICMLEQGNRYRVQPVYLVSLGAVAPDDHEASTVVNSRKWEDVFDTNEECQCCRDATAKAIFHDLEAATAALADAAGEGEKDRG